MDFLSTKNRNRLIWVALFTMETLARFSGGTHSPGVRNAKAINDWNKKRKSTKRWPRLRGVLVWPNRRSDIVQNKSILGPLCEHCVANIFARNFFKLKEAIICAWIHSTHTWINRCVSPYTDVRSTMSMCFERERYARVYVHRAPWVMRSTTDKRFVWKQHVGSVARMWLSTRCL